MKNLEYAKKRAASRLARTKKLLHLLATDGIIKFKAAPFLISAEALVKIASDIQVGKED